MRASKNRSQKPENRSRALKPYEIHISGAEGIYEESDILRIVKRYTKRALNHPRGKPDNIVITIEKIKQRPKRLQLLPINTINCKSPDEAKKIIFQKLSDIGIPLKTISKSFKIVNSQKTMRGAAIISEESALRMEPDKERGVRASRLGIEKGVEKALTKKILKMKADTTTVKEALIIASKVASNPDIRAEICISDDPDYTTGYIASKQFGYLRIPNIKKHGQKHGGRVFIIKENSDIQGIIDYLEKTPVIISGGRFD